MTAVRFVVWQVRSGRVKGCERPKNLTSLPVKSIPHYRHAHTKRISKKDFDRSLSAYVGERSSRGL